MTTENKQPKKMGRPPKPGGAMSNKERQQAWRNRQKALKNSVVNQQQPAKA
jgi:hypothetical protein